MKRNLTLVLAVVLLLTACNKRPALEANYEIVPLPKEVNLEAEGAFVLNAKTKVYYPQENADLRRNAEFLSQYVNDILHFSLEVCPMQGNETDGILLLTTPGYFIEKEAYEIKIMPEQVIITGEDAAGVFHGIQTLRKSLPIAEAKSVALPCASINDYPCYGYRGMHLDVSRHFFTIDSVKIYIDMLAMHNMNKLHFHLTDDQGWRMEMKQYPELTEIGAWRDASVIGHNSNLYDSIPHGGFYTQDELRDLVQYAADRYITIIPEIDLPGHMQAALATYPTMGCTGGPYEVWKRWGISDDVLCAGNEEAMVFLENVLSEVMDVFPSEIIHIGGDECPKVRWEVCPKCQAKIKELGIKADERFTAEDYLQSYVMDRMEKFVEAHGRRVMGWDEILEGKVGDNAMVMSWRGTEGGVEAAKKGHDVVMVPTSYLYLDYYQSEDIANEPLAIGGYVPVKRVYSFNPILEELTPEEQKHIVGVQANIWTEYIKSFNHVMYMALPRAAALSEVQWCNREQLDYDNFVVRCKHLTELYDLYHYNYATHIFHPETLLDTVAPTLATRKPIILREEPAKEYVCDGPSTLNDGVLGKSAHNSGRWIGYWGGTLDAVIDLETATTCSKLRFNALVNKGMWIYNPKSATVLVSDDGENFREIASKQIPINGWDENDGIYNYELTFEPVEARYIEVVIKGFDLPEDHEGYGKPAWLFVDEIEVE